MVLLHLVASALQLGKQSRTDQTRPEPPAPERAPTSSGTSGGCDAAALSPLLPLPTRPREGTEPGDACRAAAGTGWRVGRPPPTAAHSRLPRVLGAAFGDGLPGRGRGGRTVPLLCATEHTAPRLLPQGARRRDRPPAPSATADSRTQDEVEHATRPAAPPACCPAAPAPGRAPSAHAVTSRGGTPSYQTALCCFHLRR